MIGLSKRARSICSVCGAIAAIAGFALVPLYARSATDLSKRFVPSEALERIDAGDARMTLTKVEDPFAKPLGEPQMERRSEGRAATRSGPVRAHSLTVRALVTGLSPHALIDDGTTTRVLGVGDVFDHAQIRAIEADAVVLNDGRRLELGGGSR